MTFPLENPAIRRAELIRLHVARDGHFMDEETEARVCADPDCKVVSYAHGQDNSTGQRNRASVRCHEHGQ